VQSIGTYKHRYLHGNALHCLLHQVLKHSIDTARLLIDSYLAIGPCPSWIFQQHAQMVDLATAAQIIKHIVHEIKQIANSLTHAEATTLHEIDHFCVQPRAHGMPLVLLNKVT
jgi:hypothetical protein